MIDTRIARTQRADLARGVDRSFGIDETTEVQ